MEEFNIESLKKEIERLKSKKVWSIIVGFLGAGAIFTGAFFLKGAYPNLFYPLLLTGAGIPAFAVCESEEAKHDQEQNEAILEHVQEVKHDGVARNKAIETKKTVKANKISQKANKILDRMQKRNWSWALTALVWIAGTVAGIVYPAALWAGLAGLLAMGATSGCEIIDHKAAQELVTNYQKIKADLLLGPTYGFNPDIRNTDVKTEVRTEEATATKAKANPVYEHAVDAYIDAEPTAAYVKPVEYVK